MTAKTIRFESLD